MQQFSLEGKSAVVTGCNRGLGLALSRGLAQAGADILGVYRRDAGDAPALVAAAGRRFHGIQADLSVRSATHSVVQELSELGSFPDILVNNAGIIRRSPATEFPREDWDEVLETNLSAPFLLSQGVARQWIASGVRGKVIFIASMLSYQGGVNVSSYTASKHGILGLTRVLANEWAEHGINVNAIAPGYMATDNTAPLREDAHRNAAITARIPMGRWGTPDDLVGAAVFLSSSASDYVCGHTIAVDGGWLNR